MANGEHALDKKGCYLLISYEHLCKMRRFFKAKKGESVSSLVGRMCDELFEGMELTPRERREVDEAIRSNQERRDEHRRHWAESGQRDQDAARRKARRDAAKKGGE